LNLWQRRKVQEIEVLAWKHSVQVGGVTVVVNVAADQATETVQNQMVMRNPEGGEYTLEIVYERALKRYRFQLHSDLGETWPWMHGELL
jgi:hypothetical protein